MFLLSIQFNSILSWGAAAAPQNKTHTRYDGRHTRRGAETFSCRYSSDDCWNPNKEGRQMAPFISTHRIPSAAAMVGTTTTYPGQCGKKSRFNEISNKSPPLQLHNSLHPILLETDRPTDPCRLNLRVLSFLLRTPLAGCSKVQYR